MKKIILNLILIMNLSLFGLNDYSNIWGGLSVSLSDDLDAMYLNPAGFGVDRGKQSGFNIQQGNFNSNHTNYHIFSSIYRWESGFGFESRYDEINKYHWSLGYGTKILDKLHSGFTINKSNDYSFGILYRYSNNLSSGFTLFSNNENTFRKIRYGLAIRPYSPKFTLGFDKLINYNDDWKKDNSTDYYFINFDIAKGFNIGINKYEGKNYSLSLSINLGNKGVVINNYSPNQSTSSITANGIGFFNYSQKQKSDINLINLKINNYVELDLQGIFIEEKPVKKSALNFEINLLPFRNNNLKAIQLRDFIEKIDEIIKKDNINGLIINLGRVQAGFGKRKEIFKSLMRLKESGKEIIVFCEKNDISNMDYYIISMADYIYTTPNTSVDLKGINMEMTFLRGLLDTVSIVPEVVRISPYKTAGDPLINEKMSKEMEENYGQLMNDFYSILTNDLSKSKNWSKEKTTKIIENGPYYSNKEAINAGLINKSLYPDQFDELINLKKINKIKWSEIQPNNYYIEDWTTEDTPKIAIIYAVGGIVSGDSNPSPLGSSIMGDKTIRRAIIEAREDKNIKAIILRIDSGGGSVLASDMIWREINRTINDTSGNKKPVIVSMSDVAASGGYYIGCEADKILAESSSITGSIGVIWVRLNFSDLLKRIGIKFDGLKSNKNADFLSGSHLMTEQEKNKIFNVINESYSDFKEKVINGRENLNDIDQLDEIALGRIWSGDSAKKHGLIDEIGGIVEALESAKELANISLTSDINIEEFPKSEPFSFLKLFNDEKSVSILKFDDFLPIDLATKLSTLNLLPVLIDNELQLLMPYQIIIN